MAVSQFGVAGSDELLEVFEGGEIDGAVGEHADEAHGETAVKGANTGRAPHLPRCFEDEGISLEAAFYGFALHSTSKTG